MAALMFLWMYTCLAVLPVADRLHVSLPVADQLRVVSPDMASLMLLWMYTCLAILVMQHRRSRVAVLTFTLLILLIPSYVGFFLAFTCPTLIALLVVLGLSWGCFGAFLGF